MYFKMLMGYILGYVNIEIEGYFIERFMNICNSQKIFLWNLKRPKTTIMRVNISIRDFKKLKPIIKKTKCRVKILNKKGIPFFFHRYQKRKIFVILFLLVIVAIAVLSNFIWNIEVTGTDRIDSKEIMQILEDNKFKIGRCKIGLNTKEVIDQIRLLREDIAWVGIEINGTNANVKIVEADLKPEIVQENEHCNIVATKPGMIVKVSAVNGTPVVKEGDIVTKGSILVAGWLEGKYTGMRYVHANGEVQAKVWYSEKVKVDLKQVKKEYTNNEENKYSVKINNFQINLPKGVSKFKNYDTIVASKKLRLFSNFYLPIEIQTTTYKEYQNREVLHTKEEAKQIAINEACKKIDEQIENKDSIKNKKILENCSDEFIEVEVIYEVLENIATKEKIVF